VPEEEAGNRGKPGDDAGGVAARWKGADSVIRYRLRGVLS
jgi:hypothetical protein